MHGVHLVRLLPNAEDLLDEEEDELCFVLLIQAPIELFLQRVRIRSIKVGDTRWWFTKLNLAQLIDVYSGDHGVLVLRQSTLEGHKFELGIQDDWNEAVWQHSDLVA